MPTWPSGLCPLINTFKESPPDNAIRTEMDRGPAKMRRRTTANVRPVAFSMFLKPAQVQTLDDFYMNDTFSGVEPFDFQHPRTKQYVKARFTAMPQYTNRSTGYDVSIALEILP